MFRSPPFAWSLSVVEATYFTISAKATFIPLD